MLLVYPPPAIQKATVIAICSLSCHKKATGLLVITKIRTLDTCDPNNIARRQKNLLWLAFLHYWYLHSFPIVHFAECTAIRCGVQCGYMSTINNSQDGWMGKLGSSTIRIFRQIVGTPDNSLGLERSKTTPIFSGDSEINEKTRQNAENKQTFKF